MRRVLGLIMVAGLLLSGRAAAPRAARAQHIGDLWGAGLMDPTGMACTVTSRDARHGFGLVTTYVTDPASDTVLIHTKLESRDPAGLHVYARLDAHANGNGHARTNGGHVISDGNGKGTGPLAPSSGMLMKNPQEVAGG